MDGILVELVYEGGLDDLRLLRRGRGPDGVRTSPIGTIILRIAILVLLLL